MLSRRQEGCSNMMGVSGLHPGLWAYCEGATLPPALAAWCLDSGLSVPCFGSKELSCNCQPCASQHQHITQQKPNPEVKIRNLFLAVFNHKRAEGRKPVPLTQTMQLWLEKKRWKGWRIPPCSLLSAGSILMTFPPSVSITQYTSSTQGFPLFSLIRNFRIFSIPSDKLLSCFVLFTSDLSLSKNIPQVTANRWEQKSLAGAGTQGTCRSLRA